MRRRGHGIVVGVGNRDLGDDALGPAVCDRVCALAPHLDTWVVEADPSVLAVTWRRDDRVVLVDAVVTGAPPGTLHRLGPDDLATAHELSTHGLGAADTIRISELLGTLPSHLWILGVEGLTFAFGEPMDPAVARAVPDVAELAVDLLAGDLLAADRSAAVSRRRARCGW